MIRIDRSSVTRLPPMNVGSIPARFIIFEMSGPPP